MSLLLLFFIGTLVVEIIGSIDIKYSLDGDDWMITDPQKCKANVPGSIFVDLMIDGIIDDPYYGDNVITYKYINNISSWTYAKQFNITTEILNKNVVQLMSQGLDTKADVYLNHKLIFKNDNMWHTNYIEVKSLLKLASNNITVKFYSKVLWADQNAAQCNVSTDRLCPYDCKPWGKPYGMCNLNFIRTQQDAFGWDWGPALSSVGIWKSIYIQAYDAAVIRDWLVYTIPIKENNFTKFNLTFVVYIDGGQTNVLYPVMNKKDSKIQINGMVQIVISELNINKSVNVALTQYDEVNMTINIGIIDNPELWWPNEYGKQKLYTAEINYVDSHGGMDQGVMRQFGFKYIELMQPVAPGNKGKLFYFQINGKTIPIHGTNWIPMDQFETPSRVNKTWMKNWFIALNDSHQNMIRINGVGLYEHDYFYELCDEYGILIWHDIMFSDNQYWMPPDFINSVEKEIFDQIRKIQKHPSVAIWSGNNENEGRCKENPSAYSQLYFNLILEPIAMLDDNTRPLVVACPSNGNETSEEPCSTSSKWMGDFHTYLYHQDCWNISIYTRSRFQSEFGLQSWPSFVTMSEYLPSDQFYYNSSLMWNRNHHPDGQNQIFNLMQFHYNLPPNWNTNQSYEHMLYLTQVYQAYCYKVEIEFYRSIRYNCSNTVAGCNMGQLYWQLNDIWPGASWSSIDWKGRYKMLQYYLQHMYQSIIVAGFINNYGSNNQLYEFWVIADENSEDITCNNCKLEIFSYSWSNGSITSFTVNFKLTNPSAKLIYSMNENELLTNTKCSALTDCVIKWIVHDDQMNIINTNWMFVEPPKNSIAKDPKLQIMNVMKSKESSETFIISLNVENTAAFVWFETSILGYFNDNGLLMEPGLYQNIIFHARSNKTTVQDLKNDLYVYSLYEAGGFKR